MNVIIDLTIDRYLTFRKKTYCEIREVLEEVKIFINYKISISENLIYHDFITEKEIF